MRVTVEAGDAVVDAAGAAVGVAIGAALRHVEGGWVRVMCEGGG